MEETMSEENNVTMTILKPIARGMLERIEDYRTRILVLHWLIAPFHRRRNRWMGEEKLHSIRHAASVINDVLNEELRRAFQALMGSVIFSDDDELLLEARKEVYKEYIETGMSIATFFHFDEDPPTEAIKESMFGLKHEKQLKEYVEQIILQSREGKGKDHE
jgi:hypothetical protein